jgi:hypothetical protein
VNTEFNWWLLIVGLVAGAALVWLVLADSSRRDADVEDEEIPMEAAWIAAALRDEGEKIEPRTADRILRLHRAYLAAPPPDSPSAPRTGQVAGRRGPAPAKAAPAREEPAADWSTNLPGAVEEPSESARRPRRRPGATPPAD